MRGRKKKGWLLERKRSEPKLAYAERGESGMKKRQGLKG